MANDNTPPGNNPPSSNDNPNPTRNNQPDRNRDQLREVFERYSPNTQNPQRQNIDTAEGITNLLNRQRRDLGDLRNLTQARLRSSITNRDSFTLNIGNNPLNDNKDTSALEEHSRVQSQTLISMDGKLEDLLLSQRVVQRDVNKTLYGIIELLSRKNRDDEGNTIIINNTDEDTGNGFGLDGIIGSRGRGRNQRRSKSPRNIGAIGSSILGTARRFARFLGIAGAGLVLFDHFTDPQTQEIIQRGTESLDSGMRDLQQLVSSSITGNINSRKIRNSRDLNQILTALQNIQANIANNADKDYISESANTFLRFIRLSSSLTRGQKNQIEQKLVELSRNGEIFEIDSTGRVEPENDIPENTLQSRPPITPAIPEPEVSSQNAERAGVIPQPRSEVSSQNAERAGVLSSQGTVMPLPLSQVTPDALPTPPEFVPPPDALPTPPEFVPPPDALPTPPEFVPPPDAPSSTRAVDRNSENNEPFRTLQSSNITRRDNFTEITQSAQRLENAGFETSEDNVSQQIIRQNPRTRSINVGNRIREGSNSSNISVNAQEYSIDTRRNINLTGTNIILDAESIILRTNNEDIDLLEAATPDPNFTPTTPVSARQRAGNPGRIAAQRITQGANTPQSTSPANAEDSVGNNAGRTERTGGEGVTNRTGAGEQAQPISGMEDVKAMIIEHEGIRYEPYQDSEGKWTIGIGHLIGDGSSPGPYAGRRLSHAEVMQLFEEDFARHVRIAEQTPGWSRANQTGQAAMIDLAFNMGRWWTRWPNTSRALESGDWEAAAQGLENSRWYRQVGRRAPRIVNMIRSASGDGTTTPSGDAGGQVVSITPATEDSNQNQQVRTLTGGNITRADSVGAERTQPQPTQIPQNTGFELSGDNIPQQVTSVITTPPTVQTRGISGQAIMEPPRPSIGAVLDAQSRTREVGQTTPAPTATPAPAPQNMAAPEADGRGGSNGLGGGLDVGSVHPAPGLMTEFSRESSQPSIIRPPSAMGMGLHRTPSFTA